MPELQRLIDEYLTFQLERDPVKATRLGVHDYDHFLGAATADAFAEEMAERQRFLDRFQSIDAKSLTMDDQLDLKLAKIDLRTSLRRLQDLHIWERAPYWYLERLGEALSGLMTREFSPAEERGRKLLSRLERTPAYLNTARQNLSSEAPPLYVEMGLTSAHGLQAFLDEAVAGFAAGLPAALQTDLTAAVERVQSDLEAFERHLHGLHKRAHGDFACGASHFDFLLQTLHMLDLDHQSLHEFGLERMAIDRENLEAYAREQDPSRTWLEQIDLVKEDYPAPEDFKDTYGREMMLARQFCVEDNLITLPEGEVCHMAWVPAYLRASLPIGVMHTTPPFEEGLESRWLITPLDEEATGERKKQHMRDNCYAFARSIALHEVYPGHHLQKVHHKLATAGRPMRRTFSSPLFVEGWGLYTEDLMAETGFIHEPAVMLFKLRNALWRSVRVVIDSGLHTRGMTFQEAVDLLCDEVSLDAHMAEGEVRRYTTHNNPTYPSSYLVGKMAIKDLRRRWLDQEGDAYSLKRYHDTLLSYGSPPLKLVAERMVS